MGLRVGVTLFLPEAGLEHGLWSSGVNQNAVFLCHLLQRLPAVSEAYAVCDLTAGAGELQARFGVPALPMTEALERLDVIVELGARGDGADADRFRARGGRLVSYVAGNAMAMNFEAVASGLPYGEIVGPPRYDAVWITPQHWRMNHSYCAMTRSDVVRLAPHIWSPALLLQSAAAAGVSPFWRRDGGGAARVGVFEPNVNVLKTFHLPLLATDAGYRRRPELIDRVLVFNADHLASSAHVTEFCAATALGAAGRIFVEPRFPLAHVLGRHIDIVVTHQWENDLNYLYWDVLYLGFPLVHNSARLEGAGYGYTPFDPEDGGRALCDAAEHHAHNRTARRAQELEALWRVHIDNPANQSAYGGLLEALH